MADIHTISTQFTSFYYSAFDQSRAGLSQLYRDASMLTWEGDKFQGVTAIIEKLTSLPFEKVAHKVNTIDTQPTSAAGNLVVLVTGCLVVDDSPNPLQFTQLFHLVQEGSSYYVLNDVFRLNYG